MRINALGIKIINHRDRNLQLKSCAIEMGTTKKIPRSLHRVVVTEHLEKGQITLTVYEGAERLALVQMDVRRAVAVAGDLIEAARLLMDRQR